MGAFSPAFSPAFGGGASGEAVRFIFDGSVDDHVRPQPPPGANHLWQRFHYPESQLGLLLYRDGRVVETASVETWEAILADDVIAAGHVWTGTTADWQYGVLVAAGYIIEGGP